MRWYRVNVTDFTFLKPLAHLWFVHCLERTNFEIEVMLKKVRIGNDQSTRWKDLNWRNERNFQTSCQFVVNNIELIVDMRFIKCSTNVRPWTVQVVSIGGKKNMCVSQCTHASTCIPEYFHVIIVRFSMKIKCAPFFLVRFSDTEKTTPNNK